MDRALLENVIGNVALPAETRGETVGRDDTRVGSVRATVTSGQEVRPMNAVSVWVLRLFVAVGRST